MTRRLCALGLLLLAGACKKQPPPANTSNTCGPKTLPKSIDSFLTYQPLTKLVNPILGTSNGGNVIPGAAVPHGVVKLSPDTNAGNSSVVAYAYDNDQIQGFSHTHLEGPGGSAYGYSHILVMPTRGAIATTEAGYSSPFDHATETAQPGYYAVDLKAPDAHAELTATRLCGVHRYTFNGTDPGNILIDLAHTRGAFQSGQVEIIGNQDLRGVGTYEIEPAIAFAVQNLPGDPEQGTTGVRTVYFYAHFNRPFDSFGTWENGMVEPGSKAAQNGPLGAYATYQAASQAPIELQVCLSSISLDQAQKNYQEEVAGHSFDDVHATAQDAWNKLLNRVQIQGGTPAQQTAFYTGLYHTFLQPTDYTEDCQFWSGEDGKGTVLQAPDWDYYSDDWCMWDTYRTTHPLQMLLEPERRSDIVNSLLVGYTQGGWLNKCTWHGTGYSRVMSAIPFAPIIADAYVKGFRHYDANVAWEALKKAGTQDDPQAYIPPLCGYMNKGTPPDYLQLGYVPHECDQNQSASMTLEYAYEDWTISQFAAAAGKTDERDQFRKLAGNYRNVFNPATGFMQGRHSDGTWVTPFDPATDGNQDFTETTSWVYTWLVPHDLQGLIELIGGKQAFIDKLDQYFTEGHHDASNEPAFNNPYLYIYAGAPAKTQQRIRDVLAHDFGSDQNGLPGNDDSGAMSAYYVWGSLGLYPISPGDDTLLIGSPVFDSATIYLEPNFYGGKTFVVQTQGNGPDAPYVQSATLNGQPLTRPWLHFSDVVNGGTLVLQMGASPSTWGTDPSALPPSMSMQ